MPGERKSALCPIVDLDSGEDDIGDIGATERLQRGRILDAWHVEPCESDSINDVRLFGIARPLVSTNWDTSKVVV